jgi:predicted esterase
MFSKKDVTRTSMYRKPRALCYLCAYYFRVSHKQMKVAMPTLRSRALIILVGFFLMINSAARAMSSASNSAKRGALIFLHGLGDTPLGWSELQHALPQLKPKLKDIAYVFPAAPTIPISINGGMRMPGWFDLYDWPIGVGSKDDKEGLLKGVEQVEKEVEKLKQQGIDPSKIVVSGFSQGGAVALLAAYRNNGETAYAGCGGLSAWLTLSDELNIGNAAKKTPLFWAHGRYDDKVLFEQQSFGVDKLRSMGITVTDTQYDMGHESDPSELSAFADFVEQCIFGDEKEL